MCVSAAAGVIMSSDEGVLACKAECTTDDAASQEISQQVVEGHRCS